MQKPTLKAVPIFRIFDINKAKEFYINYLGFQIDWEHRFDADAPMYLQVSRSGFILHLTEHHGDCCPGSTVFVNTQGLDSFHDELTRKNYKYLRPDIEIAPWGDRMMQISDPFGNRLRFNQAPDNSA